MNDMNFKFPILCVNRNQGVTEPAYSLDGLTQTTSASLKNGWFTDLILIDSQGIAALVEKAEKVSGIGAFWGFDIFLNQAIRIKLQFAKQAQKITLEEMKKMILTFMAKQYAKSDPVFSIFRREFEESKSFQEAIQIYCAFYDR